MNKNYYKILNVKPNATDEEIKNSYRVLAKRYHPDVNPDNKNAAKQFADVTEAYDVLSDPQQRAAYDTKLRQEAVRAQAQAAAQARARTSNAGYSRSGDQIVLTETQLAAQIKAQVQYQVQTQLTAVRDSAYKEGYNAGYVAGYNSTAKNISTLNSKMAVLAQENDRLKKNAAADKANRAELEQELYERDRRLAQGAEKLHTLETRLAWMRKATDGGSTDPIGQAIASSRERAEALKQAIESDNVRVTAKSGGSAIAQHTRRREIKEELDGLSVTLNKLTKELEEIDADNARKRKLAEIDESLLSAEIHAADWAKKTRADRRLAKTTLYGVLGVLIWATEDEINTAYKKLCDRLMSKPDDPDFVSKLNLVREAYAVIGNPKRRKDYNDTIGCSEAKIEHERSLIKANAQLQEKYRSELAGKAWWLRFDELSSLALAGDADAQNALGEIYANGKNVERDGAQAAYWFREAFLHAHHPDATYNLGLCYEKGDGVSQNKIIAASLFRQAKMLGCKKATITE